MSKYIEMLYDRVHNGGFFRSFYGKCPDCGQRVFSIDDNVVGDKIKAKFICDCGKKWKKTVYSPEMKRYRYPQAIVDIYKDKKGRETRVLQMGDEMWFVKKDKIVYRNNKKKGKNNDKQ